MQRTISRLAVLLAGALLIAGCGSTDDSSEPTGAEQQTVASDGGADTPMDDGGDDTDSTASDAWPIVDDSEEKGYFDQGQFTVIGFTNYLMTIPAGGPEDIESYRQEIGAEPVGYIEVLVDNSTGTDHAEVYGVTLVDTDGQMHEYVPAWEQIGDWQDEVEENGGEAYSSEAVDLYNTHIETDVAPTAQKSVWLIGPEVPERMTYVEMTDLGGVHEASPNV